MLVGLGEIVFAAVLTAAGGYMIWLLSCQLYHGMLTRQIRRRMT